MGKNSSEGNNSTWIWVVLAIVVIAVIAIFAIKGCGTKEYNVKFSTDGGTSVNSLKVKENGTITMPSNPTKEGYEFAGWYLNGEIFDFNTKVTGDITLEARWNKIGEEESKITLNSSKLTLDVNETEKLRATASGNATTDGLVWKSSDDSIVTVDENGNLKALKEGKVTITVTTKDGSYSAECAVTVSEKAETETVAPTELTITGSKSVEVGKSITLKIGSVKPSNASKSVTWTSSDKKIATVSNGKVTGVKEGTVTIKATSKVDNKVVAEYTITVTPKSESTGKTEDTKITITGSTSVDVGKTIKLTAKVTPTDKTVTWKSSDNGIATVDANGTVTGVKAGSVTITATADGKSATYTVKVVAPAKDVYTFKVVPITEITGATGQSKVYVYRNGKDVTSEIQRVRNEAGVSLGKWSNDEKAILVPNGDVDKIKTVKVGNELFTMERI